MYVFLSLQAQEEVDGVFGHVLLRHHSVLRGPPAAVAGPVRADCADAPDQLPEQVQRRQQRQWRWRRFGCNVRLRSSRQEQPIQSTGTKNQWAENSFYFFR